MARESWLVVDCLAAKFDILFTSLASIKKIAKGVT
jgi:hypothetical protein